MCCLAQVVMIHRVKYVELISSRASWGRSGNITELLKHSPINTLVHTEAGRSGLATSSHSRKSSARS